MKKNVLFILVCLLSMGSMQVVKANTPAAKLDGTTMTIQYIGSVIDGYKFDFQWGDWKDQVTKIVFDESMKNSHPTSTKEWFKEFKKLTTIEHLDYLNTDKVTDMSYMFYRCEALTEVDVSKFNTDNVTNMSYMFYFCKNLKLIPTSSFDTRKVTNMDSMFGWCSSLQIAAVWNFNTANVTNMDNMFYYCGKITTIDAIGFDMSKVKSCYGMFRGCSNLKTITVSDNGNWSNLSNITSSNYMFLGCTSLVGWNGTTYNENNVDIEYARPDYSVEKGYFTKLNDVCGKPKISVSNLTQTGIRFDWDAETAGYIYQFHKVGEAWEDAHSASGSFRVYQNLKPSTEYEFRICTMCTHDVWSDWVTINFTTKSDEEGIEDVNSSEPAVKVLRNGVLYIQRNGKIYNAQGGLVK